MKRKVLIACDDVRNAYIPSLMYAYQVRGCEVVMGVANFFKSTYCPDIVHLQWPEGLCTPGNSCILGDTLRAVRERLQHFKRHGAVVVWTVHNIKPHESNLQEVGRQVYGAVMDAADVIVHHGQASVDIMAAEYPVLTMKTNIICPHGDYLIQYRDIEQSDARKALNIPQDRTVLLHFGSIRAYKGLDLAEEVFARWRRPDKYLLVAGRLKTTRAGVLERLMGRWNDQLRKRRGNCRYDLVMVPNDRVAHYFSAADIVMLSHRAGLTSGVLAMAATFGKPVVYPDIGNFCEQMEGWIGESYPVNDTVAAVEALDRLLGRLERGPCLSNSTWLARNSWGEHVERILSAVKNRRLVAGR